MQNTLLTILDVLSKVLTVAVLIGVVVAFALRKWINAWIDAHFKRSVDAELTELKHVFSLRIEQEKATLTKDIEVHKTGLEQYKKFLDTEIERPIHTERALSLKLFEKRTEVYPLLYKVLSDFIKILDFGKFSEGIRTAATKEDVRDLLLQLEDWDSKYAIFLPPHSTGICYQLRTKLHCLIKKSAEEIEHDLRDNKKRWVKDIARLELSLKHDLGVFMIHPFPGIKGFNPLGSLEEVQDLMKTISED